ncbi:MAG: hypothetical protein GX752_06165 [Clostridium sp.]|nr:hypothetical protein [Clostridium sp.]
MIKKERARRKKAIILFKISLFAILLASYLLIRFVFFNIHGMKDFPSLLAFIAGSVLLLSVLMNKKTLSIFVDIGYILGFIIAMLFNSDTYDRGGGILNNSWIIWIIVFFFSVVIGWFIEVITTIKNSRKLELDN